MAVENVKKFMDKFEASPELQRKLQESQEEHAADVNDREEAVEVTILPLAQEIGLPFTYAELQEYEKANGYTNPDGTAATDEIDDNELEQVAGGASVAISLARLGMMNTSACGCAVYGTSPSQRPTITPTPGKISRW